jgi:Leucine-rich repeat (LRR) protein
MPVPKDEMPPRLIGIWLIPGLSYVEEGYFKHYADKYGNRYNDFENEKFQKMVHLVDVPDLEVLSMLRDYEFGIDIVDGNPLTDIAFLENFPKIDSLYLGDVKISNFEPLKKLTNIRRLELGNVAIPSLELLQYFTNLQYLEFRQDYPGIVDGLELRNLTSIKHLTLNNEHIVNLEAIFDLSGEEAPSLPNLRFFFLFNYYWDREY